MNKRTSLEENSSTRFHHGGIVAFDDLIDCNKKAIVLIFSEERDRTKSERNLTHFYTDSSEKLLRNDSNVNIL